MSTRGERLGGDWGERGEIGGGGGLGKGIGKG